MVEDGHVIAQQKDVGGRGRGEDAGDGGRAGLAALGLEELDDGEGREVDEAGGGVGVCGGVGEGEAAGVEGGGAGEGGGLFAAEDGEDGGHFGEV